MALAQRYEDMAKRARRDQSGVASWMEGRFDGVLMIVEAVCFSHKHLDKMLMHD